MIRQNFSLTIRSLLAMLIAASIAYYFLMMDNFLHTSISSIINHARHLAVKKHLIVLGLLPIYIATIIFGSVSLVIYVSSRLEHLFVNRSKSRA